MTVRLGQVYSFLIKLIKWSVFIPVACTIIIMLASVVDVAGAKIINRGIPGINSYIEELNVVLVFVALGYLQLERGHLRIGIFDKYMSNKVRRSFTLFGHVLGIVTTAFFSWRTFILLQRMIESGDIKNAAMIEFPLWPFALASLYGLVLFMITFAICFCRDLFQNTSENTS